MSLSTITDRRLHVQPADVHNVLSRHMLADGYDIVMDLRKSKGSWVFDAKRGRAVLDFFTNFASAPIGYNHPRLDTPEFREKLADVAINKPANSDIYTTYMAEFVETSARGVSWTHRLHALADQHCRSAQDAVLPEIRLAAHRQSEDSLPRE